MSHSAMLKKKNEQDYADSVTNLRSVIHSSRFSASKPLLSKQRSRQQKVPGGNFFSRGLTGSVNRSGEGPLSRNYLLPLVREK